MITRFAVLPDERKLLLGIDKSSCFEPGYVYEAYKVLDEVVFRKVGKYALPTIGPGYPNEYSDANSIIEYSLHLITDEEAKKLQDAHEAKKALNELF